MFGYDTIRAGISLKMVLIVIAITGALVVSIVFIIFRTGWNSATATINSELTQELIEGEAKVEKEIEKQRAKDTGILQAVEEIWDDKGIAGPPTKEEEFKKHRDSLNHLKDLGNYGK